MSSLFEKIKKLTPKKRMGKGKTGTVKPRAEDSSSSSSSDDDRMKATTGVASKWHSKKDYRVGDRVLFKKKTYECITPHTSSKLYSPFVDSTHWKTATTTTTTV